MSRPSVFELVFGPVPPESEIPEVFMKALRCAANAWLKANPADPQAALVKAALLATNPKR